MANTSATGDPSIAHAPMPTAGLRPLNHYKSRLPGWRYRARQYLLPALRWEIPYLAYLQEHARSDSLDVYFAMSANLGTHTFFMLFLPMLFWCGASTMARSFVHVLAWGVFLSGFLKDLFCLPRPLSPPLHRITMSGSAALEYGFPSTHSTNAVSVALYGFLILRQASDVAPMSKTSLIILALVYAITIVIGRLYCGMHGFLDVICGSLLGALLSSIEFLSAEAFHELICSAGFWFPACIIGTALLMVAIHPEPADPCPCFDDGVAFIGVVIGVDVGQWHYAHAGHNPRAIIPFSWESLGVLRVFLRIVTGIACILAWRELMKPLLHRFLPPIYRFFEARIGWTLPRRYFMQASQYKHVPSHIPDDTLPPIADIPAFIRNVRRPRSDSVGPQSEADIYESIAVREGQGIYGTNVVDTLGETLRPSTSNGVTEETDKDGFGDDLDTKNYGYADNEKVFNAVEKPRTRYDVEVVTKLIVYAGIGWLAVDGAPVLFSMIGLDATF